MMMIIVMIMRRSYTMLATRDVGGDWKLMMILEMRCCTIMMHEESDV